MQQIIEDNGGADVMNEATIAKALQDVRNRISRAEQDRADLDRVITAAREEERLLLRLLALRRGDPPKEEMATPEGNALSNGSLTERTPISDRGNSTHPVLQAVVSELSAAGQPIHISDLMRRLRKARVEIPGAGTQANLIAHLRRDPRIVRPSRGMYGLLGWGLENMPMPLPRKRRRRRVRARVTMERAKG